MSHAKLYNFRVPMSSPVYEVTEQFRRSSARYVKGIKVGDKIRFSNALYAEPKWGGHRGSYATECCVVKVLPSGAEEVIGGGYLREVQKAYFTGTGEFDFDRVAHETDFTPVFRIEEV